MKTGRHFEIQDCGHQCIISGVALTLRILFITNLAMYQVSCFYHKIQDFFTYPTWFKEKALKRKPTLLSVSREALVGGRTKRWSPKRVGDITYFAGIKTGYRLRAGV